MRRRHWRWLVLAGLLFAAAALFMSLAGEPRPLPQVKMPRAMDSADYARLDRRRTLPNPAPVQADGSDPRLADRPPRLADPLMRAMPAKVKRAAIIVEANALRYSPVGQLLIDCFVGAAGVQLDQLKSRVGIDPLADVDRVGVFDGTFVVTGQFGRARWSEIFEHMTPQALNDHTTLWQPATDKDFVATWKDQMVIRGRSRSDIEETVARLEGGVPDQPPLLDERDSYGEVYGVVAPDALAELLASEHLALADRLRQVVNGIQLHVDASHDVGIVLDAKGSGADTVDFGKAVGAALVMGRMAAMTQGKSDLAQLLDYAKVVPDSGASSFRTELALPLALLQDKLRVCASWKNADGGSPRP